MEKIRVPKFYEWVFWHYDGSIFTQYTPEEPDPYTFERQLDEVEMYHYKTSKVKRAGWIAVSMEKAYRVNLKAGYTEVIAKSLPPMIYETHGEFPFITRRLDIRYRGPRAGEHEYYYVMGVGGELVEAGENIPRHFINGNFSIVDQKGAIRNDHTSEVVPVLPPEAADTMPQVIEEIAKHVTEIR